MENKSVEVYVKQSDYLTPEELAHKLNMSLKWVEKQTQAHKVPGQTKIGRLWRYRLGEVEKQLLTGKFPQERLSNSRKPGYYSRRVGRPLQRETGNGT
jgi:hypothetical protein